MTVNAALQEQDHAPETPDGINENEVREIIESIKEAQYFDASSMAPLTPASLVSISTSICDCDSDQYEGCYCSAESVQTSLILDMGSSAVEQESSCFSSAIRRPPR